MVCHLFSSLFHFFFIFFTPVFLLHYLSWFLTILLSLLVWFYIIFITTTIICNISHLYCHFAPFHFHTVLVILFSTALCLIALIYFRFTLFACIIFVLCIVYSLFMLFSVHFTLLMNEEALADWGLSCHNKRTNKHFTLAHLFISHLDYSVPVASPDDTVWSLSKGHNAI